MFSYGSLRITWPFGKTVLQAIVLAAVLIGILEIIARYWGFEPLFPPPSLGSQFPNFDYKINEMEHLVIQGRQIDCVMMGDSTTARGIDPRLVEETYREITGESLLCYNLGIGGFRFTETSTATEVIAKRYHPKFIIVGTSIRDFTEANPNRLNSQTWVRYQMGQWSSTGWLLDKFFIYRYYAGLKINTDEPSQNANDQPGQWALDYYGYRPRFDVAQPFHCAKPGTKFTYQMNDYSSQGLEEISAVNRSGVPIILLEMPLPTIWTNVDCRPDYPDFIYQLERFSAANNIPLIETGSLNLIPDPGWADNRHLNDEGAQVFSRWLGYQLGEMARSGSIPHTASQ